MDKEDLDLMKLAFQEELAAVDEGRPAVLQAEDTARADALEAAGMFNKARVMRNGVEVFGYELTRAGRHAYLKAIHA